MSIPKDPYILLSYINTKLRDRYRSLDELCDDLALESSHITEALSSIEYTYQREANRFVPML